MAAPVVRRYPTPEATAHDLATSLVERLVGLQEENGLVELCLTGGTVANLAYEHLGRQVGASALVSSRMELWWTNDGVLPTEDPRRNSLQALTRLAGALPLDASRIHPMPSQELSPDVAEAAVTYAHEIEGRTIDICLLTIGADGHVAALFPGHPAAAPTGSLAVGVTEAPEGPPEQVSLSLTTINRCREVWLIGTGEERAGAVGRVFHGDPALPASHVQGVERTVWLLDEAAAAEVPFHHCLL